MFFRVCINPDIQDLAVLDCMTVMLNKSPIFEIKKEAKFFQEVIKSNTSHAPLGRRKALLKGHVPMTGVNLIKSIKETHQFTTFIEEP